MKTSIHICLRSGCAIIFGLIIINISQIYAGNSTPGLIVFELAQEMIAPNRLPVDNWLNELQPGRDNDSGVTLSALQLPLKALNHPILPRIFKLKVNQAADIELYLQKLNNMPGVIWAEKSPIRYTSEFPGKGRQTTASPPTDPFFPLQWYLHKVYAAAAWDITRGDSSVVIAIVDNGVDIDHRDLSANLWINQAEADGEEGVDDDENGFIDDIHGWNFYDNNPDPKPAEGNNQFHGTHVAGIAAASTDNRYGMAGAGWNCRLMAVRTGSGRGITFGYEGLIYAAAAGADIINLSWGSETASTIERIAIEYAVQQGSLIVAAAGNLDKPNVDHYPAAYQSVLAVGAVGTSDKKSDFSRYLDWIDICAPGDSILSTYTENGYGVLSGTSMASPLVAGAAGLLKSIHPDWTPEQLRLQLIASADNVDDLNPEYVGEMGSGRLNMYRALASVTAGFDLGEFTIAEGALSNSDGIIDPGEAIEITVTIDNLLRKEAAVTGWISSEDRHIDIDAMTYDFGIVQAGSSAENLAQPFTAIIRNSTQPGLHIKATLHLEGDDILPQSFPIIIIVNPPYEQHDNGNVNLTLTNFGAMGYLDYTRTPARQLGEGMRYPRFGLSGLFHGSLMVGAEQGYVSDCAYGDSLEIRYDFRSDQTGFVQRFEADGVLESTARFTDRRAVHPLNIEVIQHAVSYSSPPDDDFVIIHYQIINSGRDELSGLVAALFMDWDIVSPDHNIVMWNDELEIGWMEHPNSDFPVYGMALIEGELGFQTAVDNLNEGLLSHWDWWSDRRKYELMQPGFERAGNADQADFSQLLGTLPTNLASMDTMTVVFVVLAGDDPQDLAVNLAAARTIWSNGTFGEVPDNRVPEQFRLLSIYPQPFNGRVQLVCRLSSPGELSWVLYGIDGRRLKSGAYVSLTAGQTAIPLNFESLPSGNYMVRMEKAGLVATGMITLIR